MGILGILLPFLILGKVADTPSAWHACPCCAEMQTCLQAAVRAAGVAIASGYVDLHPSGPGMGR